MIYMMTNEEYLEFNKRTSALNVTEPVKDTNKAIVTILLYSESEMLKNTVNEIINNHTRINWIPDPDATGYYDCVHIKVDLPIEICKQLKVVAKETLQLLEQKKKKEEEHLNRIKNSRKHK